MCCTRLHTIAPGPLESMCWRRFAAQWGDCQNLELRLWMWLLLTARKVWLNWNSLTYLQNATLERNRGPPGTMGLTPSEVQRAGDKDDDKKKGPKRGRGRDPTAEDRRDVSVSSVSFLSELERVCVCLCMCVCVCVCEYVVSVCVCVCLCVCECMFVCGAHISVFVCVREYGVHVCLCMLVCGARVCVCAHVFVCVSVCAWKMIDRAKQLLSSFLERYILVSMGSLCFLSTADPHPHQM